MTPLEPLEAAPPAAEAAPPIPEPQAAEPQAPAPEPSVPQPPAAPEEPAPPPEPEFALASSESAAPMHTIAEASPRSASETVVGAEEHAAAVSPYPYDLQPVQDAPAEPVAESSVPEERAEVPQPQQWADEGGWDSRAVFMPVSEVVPAITKTGKI
ncbi:hypothetical protein FB451DRAFT_1404681 [Mycena latifolia]|nr:hypothetical protein FB451DRAFT_1404681 [Mycena latifolia]